MLRVFCGIITGLILFFVPSAVAEPLRPEEVDALISDPPEARIAYGKDPEQFGDLRLPQGKGPFPVAIVIHGGCWVSTLATVQNTAAAADALRDLGVATWNIEYRGIDRQGWPGTFEDVATATDYLQKVSQTYPIDLTRVIAVGHSAGAHLALWLGGRRQLPQESTLFHPSPLLLTAVVALGGPGDLRDFRNYETHICGAPVIDSLLGGSPEAVPGHYAQGSPIELLPFGIHQVLIVGEQDPVMPERSREAYLMAAQNLGDTVERIVIPNAGHFEVIAPTSTAWPIVKGKILELLGIH
jgi:acetyl esterase/lipase